MLLQTYQDGKENTDSCESTDWHPVRDPDDSIEGHARGVNSHSQRQHLPENECGRSQAPDQSAVESANGNHHKLIILLCN